MAKRPSGTRMSKGRVTTKENPGGSGRGAASPIARAHRNDTPEALEQKRRSPKTHPGTRARTPGARRKDKN